MPMLLRGTRTLRRKTHVFWLLLAVVLILAVVAAYFAVILELDAQQREFFNDKYFGGMATLFTALAFAGIIYTAFLQKVGLDETLKEFETTNQALHYGELDRMYFDLLKIAVDKPHLRAPIPASQRSREPSEYETYAYMVWNFVETVVDRLELSSPDAASTIDGNDGRGWLRSRHSAPSDLAEDIWAARLRGTWEAAIDEEMRIHAQWWQENNAHMGFKDDFKSFANKRLPALLVSRPETAEIARLDRPHGDHREVARDEPALPAR